MLLFVVGTIFSGCKTVSTLESVGSVSSSGGSQFASGTKAVKVVLSDATWGSFSVPAAVPTPTVIPSPYPGYDGTTQYTPGIAASTFYDVDGSTVIAKPSWLQAVEVGVTTVSTGVSCAKFGDSGGSLDVNDYYRVDERSCGSVATGSGVTGATGADPVFVRVILNRNTSVLGSAENLMLLVEYQASGIRFNSDGISSDPENNLDQLWKVFWNSTLGSGTVAKTFSVFVPPNYSSCVPSGTGIGDVGSSSCDDSTYRGSPVQVRQISIPISAYPTMNVIQLSRVKGRVNNTSVIFPPTTTGADYVDTFCDVNQPLCLGVVIRSLTLMRM
jgi:hypothetical protein